MLEFHFSLLLFDLDREALRNELKLRPVMINFVFLPTPIHSGNRWAVIVIDTTAASSAWAPPPLIIEVAVAFFGR